ncbi:hypothetical protein FISHEDRAFT_39970 [Fistulina hepatica ATCC 64428]|uniref:HAT C-terminal dimerisation domain-containing protein n=1 Tax=Fistulina hepatica ATCC 64428 TaxID=1128425 RepID=A0A0D7AIE0_9AGAR|nr:hypothetical protein FISHEDRAFT_39970 [Fistulina hepatica ATCC 64428]
MAKLPKFSTISVAIQAGINNIEKWYEKTGDSDAYFICLALNPNFKTAYTEAAWMPREHKADMRAFREMYHQSLTTLGSATLASDSLPTCDSESAPSKSSTSTYGTAWMENIIKNCCLEDRTDLDPRAELEAYLAAPLTNGIADIVAWWGLNSGPAQYPTLAHMARNYLAIQGSAVAAECAFSSGALTDTRRRNHISPDLFSALQLLKGGYRNGYLSAQVQCEMREAEEAHLGSFLDDLLGNADENK